MLLLSLLLITVPQDEVSFTILDPSGKEITQEKFRDTIKRYDVIFLGEQHDAVQAHHAELEILKNIAQDVDDMVLALEMFEQDVQGILNDYLAGHISEDSFLAASRPWGNYTEDYRPLVEFAKEAGIQVIAANIPRRAAAAVARSGVLSSKTLGSDSIWIPDTLHLDSKEYYNRFEATMQELPHTGPMGKMNIDALYKAQVLKDAAMASSLHRWLESKILFVCGGFHCEYHLGIPYQLAKNHPELKIAVVSIRPYPDKPSDEVRSAIADFLWLYRSSENSP
ncbi:hypothetical protein GF359_07690 [candidate division WOR-3 bacterium]|uniref:Haem-binding uptake Tiki superfamily ChaN domain-containing protein n=1 Tax=candidate division WOR-3 bacterium TaxID=2052148 RepID=A0A9D5QCV7_UNCW3|nr:hypothetical protein [candidate division WOR-3 bacterium]MBD3365083.1 hypothetical protein [candidate division WOR-3 bacterium]